MNLHHIGIVSQDLETALKTFQLDESQIIESIIDEEQHNELFFIKFLDSKFILEIVVPIDSTSTVATFASRQKVNLHHLAFATNSITYATSKHKEISGHFELGKYQINVEAFGGKVATSFIYANGTIIEYVENVNR